MCYSKVGGAGRALQYKKSHPQTLTVSTESFLNSCHPVLTTAFPLKFSVKLHGEK